MSAHRNSVRLFDDRFHAAQLGLYVWGLLAGLTGLLASMSADSPLGFALVAGSLLGLGLAIASGVLVGQMRVRRAAVVMVIAAVVTPAWVLWPITAVGLALVVLMWFWLDAGLPEVRGAHERQPVMLAVVADRQAQAHWGDLVDADADDVAALVASELKELRGS